jgi:DNA-3-methyladenine glycosylase I
MPIPKTRCVWAQNVPDFYERYHDDEWGVPVHDERKLFEMLILEGAQAGLSWVTILARREEYRSAFKNFDPAKVARMSDTELESLLKNPGLIRNRLKIFSARKNAVAFLAIQKEFGSFDAYIWGFAPIKTPRRKSAQDIPAETPESHALSKDLKRRGMSFVGPTILYAYMQAIGMVSDHTADCFRHEALL